MVGFNFKFDFHWLRKSGLYLQNKRIFDTQLAEYVLCHQRKTWISLEETAIKYELGNKIDVVKNDYWSKGINTDEIPWEILSEYAIQDAFLTEKVYQKQLELLNPHQHTLVILDGYDQIILEEMEWNGLPYDDTLCKQRSEEIDKKIYEINNFLSSVYPDIPINFNSGDQLSAFLYGGTIVEEVREHIGFFKTGQKAGQPRYSVSVKEHILPRLVNPLSGSEMKKEGLFSTAEDTLKKLKGPAARKYVGPLLELSKLDKLNGTYYKGVPNFNTQYHWPKGMIHGSFNQCATATCRLSSSKPNLQNFAADCQDIFVSSYV